MDEELDRVNDALNRAIAVLMDHGDAVQVFLTRVSEEGETLMVAKGQGNWHARRGMVREWMIKADETAKLSVEMDDEDE